MRADGLALLSRTPSGGTRPISVTVHRRLVYVLNAGGTGNIRGFRRDAAGKLSYISGSGKPLGSGSARPAATGTPAGRFSSGPQERGESR